MGTGTLEEVAKAAGIRGRQRDVWMLWAQGLDDAEIAARLGMAQGAVKIDPVAAVRLARRKSHPDSPGGSHEAILRVNNAAAALGLG